MERSCPIQFVVGRATRNSLSGVRMQFGKVQGIALFVLGLILVLVQAVISLSPRKETQTPARDITPSVESKMTFAPGIVGGVFLLGGIWIVFGSRRSDEPPPERAVK
jgi:uncharacterized membrane protein